MHQVVRELQVLIERNGWQGKFEEAIKHAQSYNVPSIGHIQNLCDYSEWLNNLLEWVPVEDHFGRQIYEQLCEFYFFLDQPPVRELQNRIVPEAQGQPLTALSRWMVDFAEALGGFLDTAESLNPESVKSFCDSPSFNMDEYMPPPSGYKTFNQLFARHVKPGMRPVAALSDPCVITCAVDSTFLGWWRLNEQSKITVKGLEWSVLDLLEGSPYRNRFKGGIFMHGYLDVFDYHRLHVPVSGVVKEARVIHGHVYVDVKAVPIDENDHGVQGQLRTIHALAAQNGTGFQFAQTRGLIILDTPIGLVAVLPIGMGQVSSVVMTADVDKTLHKGEEFAYFQFGGSDHVMLFEAVSNVNITAQPNAHYNQGACIGYAHPN